MLSLLLNAGELQLHERLLRKPKAQVSHQTHQSGSSAKTFPRNVLSGTSYLCVPACSISSSLQATLHFGTHSKHSESNGKILTDLRGLPDRPSVSVNAPDTKLEMLM